MSKPAKGARLTGPARATMHADIRRRYLKGDTIREISEVVGRSYGFVHRALTDEAVPLRRRGGSARRVNTPPQPTEAQPMPVAV
jgi:hypothetical protein